MTSRVCEKTSIASLLAQTVRRCKCVPLLNGHGFGQWHQWYCLLQAPNQTQRWIELAANIDHHLGSGVPVVMTCIASVPGLAVARPSGEAAQTWSANVQRATSHGSAALTSPAMVLGWNRSPVSLRPRNVSTRRQGVCKTRLLCRLDVVGARADTLGKARLT